MEGDPTPDIREAVPEILYEDDSYGELYIRNKEGD